MHRTAGIEQRLLTLEMKCRDGSSWTTAGFMLRLVKKTNSSRPAGALSDRLCLDGADVLYKERYKYNLDTQLKKQQTISNRPAVTFLVVS